IITRNDIEIGNLGDNAKGVIDIGILEIERNETAGVLRLFVEQRENLGIAVVSGRSDFGRGSGGVSILAIRCCLCSNISPELRFTRALGEASCLDDDGAALHVGCQYCVRLREDAEKRIITASHRPNGTNRPSLRRSEDRLNFLSIEL